MGKADKRSVRSLKEVSELLHVVKSGDSGLQSLLDFDPDKMIEDDQNYFDDFVERFEIAEKSTKNLEKARETLKTLKARNEKRCRELNIPVKDTPQIMTLQKLIETAKDLEKRVGADTLALLGFRETHNQIKALADGGEAILKDLKRGEKIADEEIAKPGKGYADHFHCLVREGKVERIPREQLKEWDKRGEKFYKFGFSWTYKERQSNGSYEEYCPDGDKCSEHWFWGKSGDDQSTALSKAMIRLSKVLWDIRSFQKRSSSSPASKSE